MKNITQLFWLLSDPTRLRILMLLNRQELCVCQLMGVLGVSQPLISRNLSLLWNEGLLVERRQGKLAFYKVKEDLTEPAAAVLGMLREQLRNDAGLAGDLRSLSDCQAFQKKTGACDMKTFLSFMERQRKKKK